MVCIRAPLVALLVALALALSTAAPAAGTPLHQKGTLAGTWTVTIRCKPWCNKQHTVKKVTAVAKLHTLKAQTYKGTISVVAIYVGTHSQSVKPASSPPTIVLSRTNGKGWEATTTSLAYRTVFSPLTVTQYPLHIRGPANCQLKTGGGYARFSYLTSDWVFGASKKAIAASDALIRTSSDVRSMPRSLPGSAYTGCP